MSEWIIDNWAKILGTGGAGAIIVALINLKARKNNKPSTSQKSKSGNHSTTYQAGESINIERSSLEKEENKNE